MILMDISLQSASSTIASMALIESTSHPNKDVNMHKTKKTKSIKNLKKNKLKVIKTLVLVEV